MPAAPKFEVRHRIPRNGPMVLPAAGRRGRAPAWPLPGKASAEERAIWASLWHTPQAVAWEALGWTRVVGRYARVVLAAEVLDKDAMSEARQLEDRLGLTPKAMRLLLWTIAPADDSDEPRGAGRTSRGRVITPDRWREAASG